VIKKTRLAPRSRAAKSTFLDRRQPCPLTPPHKVLVQLLPFCPDRRS
jgi:hypothetical protein